MTRGKYSAKAANRAATLDNEVIASLRAELSAAEAESAELRQALHLCGVEIGNRIREGVGQGVAQERAQMDEERIQLEESLTSRFIEAARELGILLDDIATGITKKYPDDNAILPRSLSEGIDSKNPSVFRALKMLGAGDTFSEFLAERWDNAGAFDPNINGRAGRRASAALRVNAKRRYESETRIKVLTEIQRRQAVTNG